MSYDWIFNEVNNLIISPPEGFNFDPDYLHLRNPNTEKLIDEIFYENFLTKIEKAFINSPFIIFKGKDYPYFESKISVRLFKKFIVVVDDPKRPFQPGILNKMWYAKFELEIAKYDYMFSTDLHLYFSNDYDVIKIFQLMKNPYFEGLPPELSCDEEYYTLRFSHGKGAGWGLETYEEAANKISERIIKIQKILKFLNDNEIKLNIEKNFIKLENLLVNYFDNW